MRAPSRILKISVLVPLVRLNHLTNPCSPMLNSVFGSLHWFEWIHIILSPCRLNLYTSHSTSQHLEPKDRCARSAVTRKLMRHLKRFAPSYIKPRCGLILVKKKSISRSLDHKPVNRTDVPYFFPIIVQENNIKDLLNANSAAWIILIFN